MKYLLFVIFYLSSPAYPRKVVLLNINVNASSKYDIIVKNDILVNSGQLIREVCTAKKAVIITDSNVAPLYAKTVKNSLESVDFTVAIYIFNAGEASKNHHTLLEIYNFLCEKQISRKDLIIALGGGVTGDLAGYAAATFLRGLEVVQIPTTLLSQVDSSVGGKTGVNIEKGKNLVGAFKQPLRVICDPKTLNTLSDEIIKDGMGEVIKHAAIKSENLFDKLMKISDNKITEEIICDNIKIKRDVIEQDEYENGERMLLNFGHTLGHSAEKLSNYREISHGMAVSAGMAIMTKSSEMAGWTKAGTYEKLSAILNKYGLPLKTKFSAITLVQNSINDKKRINGMNNIIILKEIGESYIKSISDNEFMELIGND